MARCKKSGKIQYMSEIEALQALDRCQRAGRDEKSHYRCKSCRKWHLSSQDPLSYGLTDRDVRRAE